MVGKAIFMTLSSFIGFAANPALLAEEVPSNAAMEKNLSELDAFIEQKLAQFNVPGAAVGIVVDGKVVLAKGYGMRNVEKKLPVTENTLFAIGSCTKAFTTFLLGQLVDEGLIGWDDPVIKHIPEFRLRDVHATHHLNIRDLVTHRSGLPRHDLLWYNTKFTRADMVSRLQYLEPSCDIREKFQYNNLMYDVAGLLVEKVTGQTWEEAMKERILTPLGMIDSNLSVEDSQKSADFSLPYTEKDNAVHSIPFRHVTVAPAGSINSSISNMVHWLQVQLSEGNFQERKIVGKETLKEMHNIQIADVAQIGALNNPEENVYNFGYGLGWVVGVYKGHYSVWHNGGIDGFISNVALLPNDKMGVVILCNSSSDGHFFASSVSNTIFDKLLNAKTTDWAGKMDKMRSEFKLAMQNKNKEDAAKEETQPTRSLDEYAGIYEHPGYGIIEVSLQDKKLVTQFHDIKSSLHHQCFDIFNISSIDVPFPVNFNASFINNLSGEIAELHIPFEPLVSPIVFKKKPSNALISLDYLKQFEGLFEGVSMTVKTEIKGNALILTVHGQPPCELVPIKPMYFSIKAAQGLTVHFVPGENGKMSEAVLTTSAGIFNFKAKQ